jgi:hypothetical protein
MWKKVNVMERRSVAIEPGNFISKGKYEWKRGSWYIEGEARAIR